VIEDTPGPDAARRALLDAASTLLAEEGAETLTVRRVAARAGCSTMLVYSRLGGKQGVMEALYIEGFERLADALRSGRRTADPVSDLRVCAQRYRKFALANPTYYAVMFERAVPDFEPSFEAKMVASRTLDVLADRVQRAIDAGVFPAQDARGVAASLWSNNHGVLSLELKRVGPPDIDWAKCFEQVLEAMLAGLAKPS
jgi:AcrR family transcriptional regulator